MDVRVASSSWQNGENCRCGCRVKNNVNRGYPIFISVKNNWIKKAEF